MVCSPASSFTCKSRHTRCDEKKPICSNCERLGLECRASEFILRSAWCPSNTTPSSRGSGEADVAWAAALEQPASTWDIFNSSNLEFHLEHSGRSSSTSSPNQAVSDQTGALPSIQNGVSPLVPLNAEMVFLLNTYRTGIATWMDIFDHNCTYAREVSRRALVSELLLKCICCFAARQLCLLPSGDIWGPVATRYYAESLNLLINQLSNPAPQGDALTAVILLSSYELLAAEGPEHRRHYDGAMKLIRVHGINAASVGLDRANFWVYIRHDIVLALSSESPLQFSPTEWNFHWGQGPVEEDEQDNQLMWLVGRSVNLTYGGGSAVDREQLILDIQQWKHSLPISHWGTRYGEPTNEGLSKMHFAIPAAAASMMWYHLMHILLHAEPQHQNPEDSLRVQEHATEILNIGISDIPDAVRCFGVAPLYYAGKHVNGIMKKTRAWILLHAIEQELGYHTRSRVEALQHLVEASM